MSFITWHFQKSAEDNEMVLARCKEELLTAQKKIAELENISLEVDVDKVSRVVYVSGSVCAY